MTLRFGAAHTYMAHIREHLPPPPGIRPINQRDFHLSETNSHLLLRLEISLKISRHFIIQSEIKS